MNLYAYINDYQSPFGRIIYTSNGQSLTGLWFECQKYFPKPALANALYCRLPVFDQTADWLDQYFNHKIPDFTPPIDLKGTPFRISVWNILKQIPYGKTITYKMIAEQLVREQSRTSLSCQAVGGAVGHNPISVIIPCHRVIGSDGSLTGYAGGLDLKKALLKLEGAL